MLVKGGVFYRISGSTKKDVLQNALNMVKGVDESVSDPCFRCSWRGRNCIHRDRRPYRHPARPRVAGGLYQPADPLVVVPGDAD